MLPSCSSRASMARFLLNTGNLHWVPFLRRRGQYNFHHSAVIKSGPYSRACILKSRVLHHTARGSGKWFVYGQEPRKIQVTWYFHGAGEPLVLSERTVGLESGRGGFPAVQFPRFTARPLQRNA